MIIKLDSEEREQLEKTCALWDLKCRIFTMENNPNLVQAEVLHEDGGEIAGHTAWYLCASVYTKIAIKNV